MELNEIRKRIDRVDDDIKKLFEERMELAREVALQKQSAGARVEDKVRQNEIVCRLAADLPDSMKLYIKQFYGVMFDISKAYQASIMQFDSPFKDEIEDAISKGVLPFPKQASVACQGVMGAYSVLAAERLFPIASVSCFKNWDGVFTAVEKGFCDFGVLPIENSTAGSVIGVYDLMRKHKFYIARCIKLKVSHCLLAKRGAKLADIKEIISHDQAIAQCAEFIKTLGDVRITRCDNTALAAKAVMESERGDMACISSRECAALYGLQTLRTDINDSDSNYTRFIAITDKLRVYEGANKISVTVGLPHEAGSLNQLLGKFSSMGLNLTKLESRPVPGSQFEFNFYFDFDARITSPEVRNLLSEIALSSENFEFLGAYEEI